MQSLLIASIPERSIRCYPMRASLFLLLILNTLGGFAQSASPPATPTFKVGTTNVLLDVVVTDHHGVPVEGLTQDSFTVFEDGHPQPIVLFEPHFPSSSKSASLVPSLPAGAYSNAPGAADGTADVLLLDALNTPTGGQVQAHK